MNEFIDSYTGMKFVLIPPGNFMMGSPEDEEDRNVNETWHQVTISQPFYMQTTPVTQGQWDKVMGSKPSYFKGNDRPVEQVNWKNCQEFITRFSELSGKSYRLPTEAEWEYACRAGTTASRFGDIDEIAWYESNSQGETHPVGQKKPNAWGLYDMLGNIWEWCNDWYGKYPNTKVTDPVGPPSGKGRVLTGGCFNSPPGIIRAALRNTIMTDSRCNYTGCRLALSARYSEF